jgi:hypothetical protein
MNLLHNEADGSQQSRSAGDSRQAIERRHGDLRGKVFPKLYRSLERVSPDKFYWRLWSKVYYQLEIKY